MNTLAIAALTDTGRRRSENQDTFICSTLWSESSALLAVIDGVGGYAGGEQAAAIARESIEQYMAKPNGDPLSMLCEAVVFANNQINAQRQQDERLMRMCCVLTTVVVDIHSHKLYFVHVGDTRLYRCRQGKLEKLTRDHSLVGVREDAHELSETEAMSHPRRNEILREVGLSPHRVDDPDFLDWGEMDFQPGDQILLCSDGLTDMITQAQVRNVLHQSPTLDEQLTDLIRLANAHGGHDNITVVLARNDNSSSEPSVVPGSEQPSSSPSPDSEDLSSINVPATNRSGVRVWSLLTAFLVGGLAVWAWYQWLPLKQSDGATGDSLQVSETYTPSPLPALPGKDSRLDSLLGLAYRSQSHQLVLSADTFRLHTPLVLTDSLISIVGVQGLTVIVPIDSARIPVALFIARRGTVHLENIIISGFETGLETMPDTRLQLKNVYFRAVGTPLSAVVQRDSFPDDDILIEVKNQPDRAGNNLKRQ